MDLNPPGFEHKQALSLSARLQQLGRYNEAQAALQIERELMQAHMREAATEILLKRQNILLAQQRKTIADLKKENEILMDPTNKKNRSNSLNG